MQYEAECSKRIGKTPDDFSVYCDMERAVLILNKYKNEVVSVGNAAEDGNDSLDQQNLRESMFRELQEWAFDGSELAYELIKELFHSTSVTSLVDISDNSMDDCSIGVSAEVRELELVLRGKQTLKAIGRVLKTPNNDVMDIGNFHVLRTLKKVIFLSSLFV
jgi:hypothetical protein